MTNSDGGLAVDQISQKPYTDIQFESFAHSLETDLIVPEAGLESIAIPFDDFARSSAFLAVRSSPILRFLKPFDDAEDEAAATASFKDVYKYYKDARNKLESYQDIVSLVLRDKDGKLDPSDIRVQMVNYLLQGECLTRLGEKISVPKEDSSDRSLYLLLGVVRIVNEDIYSRKFHNELTWLAGDSSPEAERFKKYERQAGRFAEHLGSSIGRAASVASASIINPLLKLPDEVTIAISYIAGLQARKAAELQMHRYLVANPGIT